MRIKVNDVFYFSYHPLKEQGYDGRRHCFEGLLVARKNSEGKIQLEDTYWGVGGSNSRVLKPEQAKVEGELKYYCNLDKIEEINLYDAKYYADKDLFMLHSQNACVDSCKYLYKTKGTKRSKEKMLSVVSDNIAIIKRKISGLANDLERETEKRVTIKSNNLDIYI